MTTKVNTYWKRFLEILAVCKTPFKSVSDVAASTAKTIDLILSAKKRELSMYQGASLSATHQALTAEPTATILPTRIEGPSQPSAKAEGVAEVIASDVLSPKRKAAEEAAAAIALASSPRKKQAVAGPLQQQQQQQGGPLSRSPVAKAPLTNGTVTTTASSTSAAINPTAASAAVSVPASFKGVTALMNDASLARRVANAVAELGKSGALKAPPVASSMGPGAHNAQTKSAAIQGGRGSGSAASSSFLSAPVVANDTAMGSPRKEGYRLQAIVNAVIASPERARVALPSNTPVATSAQPAKTPSTGPVAAIISNGAPSSSSSSGKGSKLRPTPPPPASVSSSGSSTPKLTSFFTSTKPKTPPSVTVDLT